MSTRQPICPLCSVGYLHPYKVEIGPFPGPSGWHGAKYLVGWVAVCVGNAMAIEHRKKLFQAAGEEVVDIPVSLPCGFSMPMTGHKHDTR